MKTTDTLSITMSNFNIYICRISTFHRKGMANFISIQSDI
jgi:hypothetical protein